MNPNWNISLFHYRNSGGDVCKVLVGIQVAKETEEDWLKFLKVLQFPFVEETENEVYNRFLRGIERK